ncbi:M14 family metallopeptidase [Luteimonas vadosa]|uniref:M14 family metallopeptidase n=1 Tax=Luteimonas vadosa TaxID=1165507 RepID=A0ABP9E3N6_9GAMM
MRYIPSRLLLALLLAFIATAPAAQDRLTTVAERSGFRETGRYQEVVSLCHDYARRYADAVRCSSFGTTPEGRPMQLLVASRTGALTAGQARARKLPVVLVQGGIHAGEIDGKDAGFLALREILEGQAATGALDRLVVLFVPVFNVDGHERFGRWNRPNQRGPEQMGWRTTAQNHNLNRDYLKADAPEMRAMLGLVDEWDPLLTIDLHATNGAKFQHDISIQVEPLHSGDAALRKIGRDLRDGVIDDLSTQGSLPLPFYPSFVEDDNPASGFADGVAPPRFSHGYFPLRNRFAMLVETHSWKEYPARVRATRNTVVSALERAAAQGQAWMREAASADLRAARLAGKPVPLDYKADEAVRTIDFRGYAYARTPSEVSGALMTRYDEAAPVVWRIPLRDRVEPGAVVTAPKGGYIVPAMHARWVGEALGRHGITFRTLDESVPRARVQAFRADSAEFAAGSTESHQRLSLVGQWKPERRTVDPGALFVPIAQPLSRVVVAMLEPQAPDSLVSWGMFNNHFERKEYMEAYVAEEVAREMLARDSGLRKEFARKLREDPAFAASPRARLEFFYRRHSSWDERYNLYPVLRTATVPR